MKLASWNVNGIRACLKKNFWQWLTETHKDFICLQEVKAQKEQLDEIFQGLKNYHRYYACAEKKGYSGVIVLAHESWGVPLSARTGLGIEEYDREGRTIILEYETFFLVCSYFPNGQRDHGRVDYKLKYSRDLISYIQVLRGKGAQQKEVIICGDFNTAHQEIDLKNPKGNINTTGFLPRERAFLDEMIQQGYIDIFRVHHPLQEGHYTWWSYRPGCRSRNIGWRIDYFFITAGLRDKIKRAILFPDILGSDHCPLEIEL